MPTMYKRIIWLLIIILLAGLSSMLSCARAPAAVEIAADGALMIPARGKEIRLRAYRPDVELTLTWEEREGGPVQIVVENLALTTVVKVMPEPGQQAASCSVSPEGPASLVLSLEGSGRQRLQLSPSAKEGAPFFAVFGDSQGHNEVLAEIVKAANSYEVDFLICLGDMVASGTEEEYRAFQETMAELNCPYYTVPGNHDIKGEGADYYRSRLATGDYFFDYAGYRFIFMDSALMTLSEAQLEWMQETLDGGLPGLIFLHVPPLDPRKEGDHAFLDPSQAEAFLNLLAAPSSRTLAVFSGHIHMFHHQVLSGVHHVISGGGGASLYAPPDQGGYHHFTLCRLTAEGLQVEPVPVEAPPRPEELVVSGPSGDCIYTLEELDRIANLEKELSFQNRFGNYAGEGLYRGVPVSTLIEQTGGMKPGDILMVYALDGYSQAFAYENVYPESAGWEERQGIMALAVEFNGQMVPEWQDGYRIAFFTEDGVYDNEDCALTSAEGQGWHLYESAGGRWVKTVVRMEVISG